MRLKLDNIVSEIQKRYSALMRKRVSTGLSFSTQPVGKVRLKVEPILLDDTLCSFYRHRSTGHIFELERAVTVTGSNKILYCFTPVDIRARIPFKCTMEYLQKHMVPIPDFIYVPKPVSSQ